MTLLKPALAAAIAVGCAAALGAQSTTTERHEKTKIEVKGGKHTAVTGCLDRTENGPGYVLTDREGGLKYALVSDDDLSKYVGHRVKVEGNAADRGDGKVKIERKVEGTSGAKADTKVEAKGDEVELPYLGVKSIKSVAGTCD